MDITTVLDKHGVSLASIASDPNGSLASLNKAYSELLDTLTAETETQQNREKAIRDEMAKNVTVSEEAKAEVRKFLASIVDSNEDVLPALVEEVQNMKQDLMVLRDYHVSDVARKNKPEKVKDSAEIEIRKQEASSLREAIESVFSLAGRPENVEGFATKKNSKNEVVPDLPRVPGGNTSGNVGRGAKIRQLNFEIDGDKIPAGTLFYDVVRKYLCDFANGNVVKPTDVKDKIDASGQTFTPEGYDNKWTVEMNGHTLSGWLPVEAE